MTTDERYMARCLQLARLGKYFVAPNPMVGAVIVCKEKIIGEGYHQAYGQPHAEPNAIRAVNDPTLLPEATLYVNLEPCSHWGKTPPCAHLIVEKKIKRVVIGCLDPNPKVAGNGVKILQQAGVDVTIGVLKDEARLLNKRFITFHEQKRPFVLLKWAQTKDGFIDVKRNDSSLKALRISNNITTQLTHKMRAENMAILVSSNTVLLDNPSLTVRNWSGKNPVRVVIDRYGKIPDNVNVKTDEFKTFIFTTTPKQTVGNVEYITIPDTLENLSTILMHLHRQNMHSVLVEGGAALINSFIRNDLWDEANVEISQQMIGSGVAAPILKSEKVAQRIPINGHQWLRFVNR